MTTRMAQAAPRLSGQDDDVLGAAETLAGVGNWRWARNKRKIELSAGMARIAGAGERPGQLALRAALRLIGRPGRRDLFAAIRASAADNSPTVEFAMTALDGAVRSVTATIRRSAAGDLWGVCQDVTMMRLVSDALDRSESRWEIALETARQGVWDSNIEAGTVYHSRTWRVLRGMNPGYDARDSHEGWLERVHPDDLERCLEQMRAQHAGDIRRAVMEYRERHMDGHYMWISSVGSAVDWFPDGRPKRIVGTDTEITIRKTAEAEMALLQRRLELALEVAKVGVFEADLSTGELYWDNRIRDMYGKPLDGTPIGPTEWDESIHPDDAERAIACVNTAIRTESAYAQEFRIVRPDGGIRTIRTTGTHYRGNDNVPRILGANWDVTAEVAAKQALERAMQLAEARNHELEEAKSRIEHNALHDTLTGLPNRRYLDVWLANRAAWCAEHGGGVALLHIDLDRFKQINDTLGHIAGDAMLVHAAKLLRENLTGEDFVARVGGDEFIVVCSYAGGAERPEHLARSIVEQMRRPVPYEGHFCRFGASIGIALQSGTTVDPQRLLIDADIALYRAKRRGRNGFEFFSESLQAETINTKRVADDILRGIEQDEFLPFYQPVFDAHTQELVGVEALARWNHPVAGTLAPASFLKIAEDLNVVTSIDRIILERALADFDRWAKAGFSVPSVSVNVSFRRLHDENLIASLKGLPIRPGTLSFELLESIFLDEPDDIVSWNIEQIRELGIDIDIDDFGTGHASILSLVKLRPRRFKIDRQFIESIASSESQRRLVGSLVDIGRSLSIKVVAEGVETMEQAQILQRLGCDILQGYAFARPMSAAALETMLRAEAGRRAS